MEAKDYVLLIGVGVTLVLGVWNLIQGYLTTRKTSFINTITGQRILWIEQLRQDVAKFSGLTHTWCMSELEGKPEESEALMEIDRLRYVIRLRLNPDDTPDRKIAAMLNRIPELTHSSKQKEMLEMLEELTVETQHLIKDEWEKVKKEAVDGRLAEHPRKNA